MDKTDKHWLIAYQRQISKMRAWENYVQLKEAEKAVKHLREGG